MHKKNICFYSGDITNSGGTERVAIIIANELNKRDDYNISILSLTEKKDKCFFEIDESIPRYTIYDCVVRGITHIGGIINRTRKIIQKYNIEILIDIDGILDMYSLPVKLFTDVKVISWEHYNFYQHPIVPYRRYTRKMAARWADAIVTLTEEDRKYYTSNLNVKCPIQFIYNPVIWEEQEEVYDECSKIILSAGRLTYQKGFDMLVDVAELLLKKYPDWKWLVLGEGNDRATLEEKTKEKGLERQLLFPGNVDDIGDYYKKTAIFVMTSRFEGLPMTLLEAKNYKLPIISFDCKTGPRELIKDNINGYLIEENNIQQMADKIVCLLESNDKRKEMSEQALLDMNKFNLDKIIEKWINLIENM